MTQTPRFRLSRRALAPLLAAGVLALAGCAAFTPKTPEQVVAERAEARWDALIHRNFEKAWEYTQPAYRALVAQKDYSKQFGAAGQWKGVQVHQVTCEPERCTVRLRLTSTLNVPRFQGQELIGYIDETWVRSDGQWWFYQSL